MTDYQMGQWQALHQGQVVDNGTSYIGVSNCVEDCAEPRCDMTWTCDSDTDDDPFEMVIDLQSYANLLAKAKAYDALVSKGTLAE